MILRLVGLLACSALTFVTGCTTDTQPAGPGTSAPAPGVTARNFADLPGLVQRIEPSVVTVFAGEGSGSGVVYRSDGIIVTNAHVVGDVQQTQVAFADGRRVPGAVIATDTVTDLALIRTDRKDLPAATFATALPRPGELVLALGTPLGFENSVTAGIVSGLGREIPGSASSTRALVDLIQTDAAISPGNSGGALINSRGEVVGINEAYIPPKAGAVSLGFAIPAATVTDVADELLAIGKASHPFLGIAPARLTQQIAEALNLGVTSGVLVREVVENGPAAKAGVQPGDVITRLADQDVRTVEEFLGALRGIEPRDRVLVKLHRSGEELTLTIDAGTLAN